MSMKVAEETKSQARRRRAAGSLTASSKMDGPPARLALSFESRIKGGRCILANGEADEGALTLKSDSRL
jgi:hypothetical protein